MPASSTAIMLLTTLSGGGGEQGKYVAVNERLRCTPTASQGRACVESGSEHVSVRDANRASHAKTGVVRAGVGERVRGTVSHWDWGRGTRYASANGIRESRYAPYYAGGVRRCWLDWAEWGVGRGAAGRHAQWTHAAGPRTGAHAPGPMVKLGHAQEPSSDPRTGT